MIYRLAGFYRNSYRNYKPEHRCDKKACRNLQAFFIMLCSEANLIQHAVFFYRFNFFLLLDRCPSANHIAQVVYALAFK
jgi:hypothetical protein